MNYNYALSEFTPALLTPVRGGKSQIEQDLRIANLSHFLSCENFDSPSRKACLEIFWIREGSCHVVVNGTEHPLSAGKVCCVAPGQSCLLTEINPLKGQYLRVSGEMLHNVQPDQKPLFFPTPMACRQLLVLPIDAPMELAGEILLKMQDILQDFAGNDTEILKGYLRIFLLYMSRSGVAPAETRVYSRENDIVEQFLSLIREKFIQQKMVADYAAELFVTAAYLNRIVKKVSGYTASHHIQQYIILEAKRLCMNSRMSMKEIAYGLGFNDIAHFSKFFKNYTGKNFTSFKREVVQVDLVYAGVTTINA
ncbi:MAG: helix-turn-helix domain-containing protein [Chitinophagaceae bacterium]